MADNTGNFDFDVGDILLATANGNLSLEEALARTREARDSLVEQVRKGKGALEALTKLRDSYKVTLSKRDIEQGLHSHSREELLQIFEDKKAQVNQEIAETTAEMNEGPSGLHQPEQLIEEQKKAKLRRLLAMRNRLIARLARLRYMPFDHLPPEIIEQIFFECTRPARTSPMSTAFPIEGGPLEMFRLPEIQKAPLLLTLVCKTWRNLAISMPWLWSTFDVRISTHRSGKTICKPPLSALEDWLSRSGSCPLTFQISAGEGDPGDTLEALLSNADARENEGDTVQEPDPVTQEEVLSSLMKVLSPHHARWASASFKLWFPEGLKTDIFSAFTTTGIDDITFPALHDLHIARTIEDARPADLKGITIILEHSPNLRCLRWGSQMFGSFAPHVPWSQLTSFYMAARMHTKRLHQVLADSPNLQTISLRIFMGEVPEERLVLPNLEEIALSFDGDGSSLKPLLNVLTVPNLRSFSLTAESITSTNTQWAPKEWVELIRRSQCKINVFLTHNIVFCSDDDLIQTLLTFSDTLQNLSLRCDRLEPFVTDPILKELTLPYPNVQATINETTGLFDFKIEARTEGLCPRMQFLSFWNCLGSSDGVLSEMVSSRKRPLQAPGCKNLGCSVFTLRPGHHDQDAKAFDNMNKGLAPTITYIVI